MLIQPHFPAWLLLTIEGPIESAQLYPGQPDQAGGIRETANPGHADSA
jgi:hypothetical protein